MGIPATDSQGGGTNRLTDPRVPGPSTQGNLGVRAPELGRRGDTSTGVRGDQSLPWFFCEGGVRYRSIRVGTVLPACKHKHSSLSEVDLGLVSFLLVPTGHPSRCFSLAFSPDQGVIGLWAFGALVSVNG